MTTLDVSTLYADTGQAKFEHLESYLRSALDGVSPGDDVLLTGAGPIWLYLKIAHALHGRARILTYEDGMGNRIEIFNHDPE